MQTLLVSTAAVAIAEIGDKTGGNSTYSGGGLTEDKNQWVSDKLYLGDMALRVEPQVVTEWDCVLDVVYTIMNTKLAREPKDHIFRLPDI